MLNCARVVGFKDADMFSLLFRCVTIATKQVKSQDKPTLGSWCQRSRHTLCVGAPAQNRTGFTGLRHQCIAINASEAVLVLTAGLEPAAS